MPPSIWSIGKGAVADALLFAVFGAILEAILGARFLGSSENLPNIVR